MSVKDVWGHRSHTLEWSGGQWYLMDPELGREGNHPLRIPGKGAHCTLSLPTGSPRMWWAVGRAKRNLLVLWLRVWRMDDTHVSPGKSGAAKSLGWMVPPLHRSFLHNLPSCLAVAAGTSHWGPGE